MHGNHGTHTLADFLQDHEAYVQRLKATRMPQVLTVDGRAEVVLPDARSYAELMARLDRAETIAAIREGIASAQRGELKPAERVFAEIRAKYGLQG